VSFAGTVEAIGLDQREIVVRGWDLASLREHYEQVEGIIGALAPQTSDEKLFESIRLSNEYQVLPALTRSCPRPSCQTGSDAGSPGASKHSGPSGNPPPRPGSPR
jgi:hypothetical protein